MIPIVPFRLPIVGSWKQPGRKLLVFIPLLFFFSFQVLAQCTTPTATIAVQPGAATCNGQSFNLILASSTDGTAPFDLTIDGPGGSATYNDIPVGGVIGSFSAPVDKLWPSAPAIVPPTNDDASVTLGVKFRSSVAGFVKGVRFFSPDDIALEANAYTGQLWSAGGSLLASGTYSGLSNSSWQELIFTTPVYIEANTVYVASYHTKGTKYVGTTNGFAFPVNNGSLTAPDNVSAGGNGVYAYGTTASFPANSVGANYWVDVIFSPSVYSFNLTGVKDANECSNTGALQTLNITSTDCSALPVTVVVTPPTATTSVGQSFTVFVAADFSGTAIPAGIDELELHLSFDNTKLAVTSMTEQPVVNGFTSKPIPLESAPYTNTNTSGQVSYAASTTGAVPVNDFNILAITFSVISGSGSSTPLTPTGATKALRNGNSVMSSVAGSSVFINATGCITPTATIAVQPGSATCNGQAFNLVLANSTAGVSPFDLTISGPGGTVTYDDIAVGDVITNFNAPTEKLWPSVPAVTPATNEDASVTLGVKFKSSVSGFVKGVRFFSPDDAATAPGTFTGQLWSTGGNLLASGTFINVTSNGWQELVFATPVLISANTIYVASYHTSDNKYVGTPNGFATGFSNGSLSAPDHASAGGNGVYAYGATAAYPLNSVGANYWVDVIFAPNVYTFSLTGIKDSNECTNTGTLQTLSVNSSVCSSNALPVTLVNLSATPADDKVILQWQTSSELNNLGFEVQRSSDGASWSALSFVNGAGNSNATLKYAYADEKLTSGIRYYYRLKQVDIDKRFTYSPIVSAILNTREGFRLDQNYPNPTRSETIIRFALPYKSKVNIALYDMSGRMVKVLVNDSREAGTHAVTVDCGTLTKGLYLYRLQAGEFSAVKKLTIQ